MWLVRPSELATARGTAASKDRCPKLNTSCNSSQVLSSTATLLFFGCEYVSQLLFGFSLFEARKLINISGSSITV
jgi:hypothetical protein